MSKITANFKNQTIYVGLDVQKRSWNTGIFVGDMFVKNIYQQPPLEFIYKYLNKQFPGASYQCAYDSAKFGYLIQRQLSELGITSLVVNPAHITFSHKDEVYKTIASIRVVLAKRCPKGSCAEFISLHFIRKPTETSSGKEKIWRNLARCNIRVKGFLDYNGINLPEKFDNPNWSRIFIT